VNPRFAVLNPCSKRWADLQGEGRERYCETCKTPVYDYSQYSAEEWDQVWQENGGKVCGLLCNESPEPPRSRRAILAGALLSFVSPLFAQDGRVRIRVTDETGVVIPFATCSLLDKAGKATKTVQTNEVGEALWVELPTGASKFSINRAGFREAIVTVMVMGGGERTVDVTLRIGANIGEVVTVSAEPRDARPDPLVEQILSRQLTITEPQPAITQPDAAKKNRHGFWRKARH
jgi:hypothetical protein